MIDPARYGVSFSLKQCRNFGIDATETLDWLLAKGWRRFRLMSYWNEHEKQPNDYDFSQLDWQLDRIARDGGVVTLCLGIKQPRWPEYHWPAWALELSDSTKTEAILKYITRVIEHVQHRPEIISYQLENEALLEGFGRNIDINRQRLREEFKLIKQLDPSRPVIMTTSTSWGVPFRQPMPDIIGFSFYKVLYNSKWQRYSTAFHSPTLDKVRAGINRLRRWRPSFIHELQTEPWGHDAIWKMSTADQDKSMDSARIVQNIRFAQSTGLYPIDLWGGEWWYWRYLQGDSSVLIAVESSLD